MSVEALAAYATCARQWWLENYQHDPPHYLLNAQISLRRRQQLALRLALVGGGLMGLAVLLVLAGLLFR